MYNKKGDNMSYKLIFCDLDETLLDKNRNIPQKNIDAIQKAKREYGVKFVCATGRHFSTTMDIVNELGLYNKENEYVCSLNGAILTENHGNRVLHSTYLNADTAAKLIQFGLDHHVCIELYTDKNTYIYNLDDEERKFVNELDLQFIEVLDKSYDYLKDEHVLKLVYELRDFQYLQSLESKMSDVLDDVIPSYSSNRYMELFSKDTSKGIALEWLANYLNIDIKDTIAIGDHYNDVAMLKAAGLSVAANNAQEGVKEICDYVTNASNNEGVVCEVLEKFVFGEYENE